MAKSFVTNLDELENEINDLLKIDKVSKQKQEKNYDFNKNEPTKLNSRRYKLRRKPSNLSNGLNVDGRVGSCPSSSHCICKTNHLYSSKSSIQPNSVKSVKIIAKSLTKEIKKAKSNLNQISQKKTEAKAMAKYLKLNFADLIENKDAILKHVKDLIQENTTLKKELMECRQSKNENKKQIDKLTKIFHEKTEKSAMLLFDSENKLNKRLQQKNDRIETLSKLNLTLGKSIEIKNSSYQQLNEKYNELHAKYQNIFNENKQLAKNNRDLEILAKQWGSELDKAKFESSCCKDYIDELTQQIVDMKNGANDKGNINEMENLLENYKIQLEQLAEREKIQNKQIQELEEKIAKIESVKNKEIAKVKTDNQKLHLKLREYEECASKCKQIEEKCKCKCEIAKANEEYFVKERKEFEQLIDELTSVVKQNKYTLLELSKMNKFQENLIKNQSDQLLSRQKELDSAVSEIEIFKKRSRELEIEIESLKQISEESLKNKETCASLMHELDTLRLTLDKEKANKKIIEEQSETITCIKNELEQKTNELNNIKQEMFKTENEMKQIKNELESKKQELQKELFEKEILNDKLMKLELEKNDITIEMENLQELLETYNASANLSVREKSTTASEASIENEKNKAMTVATFATQKLLETVTDYQFEIDEQKRMQYMLTDLLRNKDEQLNLVKSKMTSLTEITHVALEDLISDSMNKINLNSCTPSTMTTQYESCESTTQKPENCDLEEILNLLKN